MFAAAIFLPLLAALLLLDLEAIRGEVAPTMRFDPRAHGVSTTGRPSVVADPTPHDEESTR